MHSKSDNLGYLKDQKREIFQGLCLLDPHPGLTKGGGVAKGAPSKPPSSKVLTSLAIMYLFFFRTHASCVVACLNIVLILLISIREPFLSKDIKFLQKIMKSAKLRGEGGGGGGGPVTDRYIF